MIRDENEEENFLDGVFDEFVMNFNETTTKLDNDNKSCQPDDETLSCLRKNFGHKNFRLNQWKIIASIIKEKNDNCAIMTTGYGKSLCYQFPPVYLKQITVVVSPLISLMEDQVLSLQLLNIEACFLGTAQKDKSVLEKVMNFEYRLVYLTPEFITSDIGERLLEKLARKLCLIAIDEAHCISKWGHDFRKSFSNLGCIRRIVPDIPILAMTATATQKVQQDIINSLKLRNPQVICTGFDRPNLELIVRCKSGNVWNDIGRFLQNQNSSTIIYCLTRNSSEEIANLIKNHGIASCDVYHAGLTINRRKEIHRKFVRDEIQIIVATIAFGMGIDKPDIRTVIHYGACPDIESYYQEIGRAGRDGMAAKCILFYNMKDFEIHKFMREKSGNSKTMLKNLEHLSEKMFEFISITSCRRSFILQYFEGSNNTKKSNKNIKNCCDNCNSLIKNQNRNTFLVKYKNLDENGFYDFTKDAEILLKSIDIFKGHTGLQTPILFLRGSNNKKIPQIHFSHVLYGAGKSKSVDWWKSVAELLMLNKYIQKQAQRKNFKTTFTQYTVSLSSKSYSWLNDTNRLPIKLKLPQHMQRFLELEKNQQIQTTTTTTTNSKSFLTQFEFKTTNKKNTNEELLKSLYKIRTSLASKLDVMPYMIVSNRALHQLSEIKPLNVEDLKKYEIDGFSEIKIQQFASYFIKCILDFHNKTLPNDNIEISKQQKLNSNFPNNSEMNIFSKNQQPCTSTLSNILLDNNVENLENTQENDAFWESDIEIDYDKIDYECERKNKTDDVELNKEGEEEEEESIIDKNFDEIIENAKKLYNYNSTKSISDDTINELEKCDDTVSIEKAENVQQIKPKRKFSYQLNRNKIVYTNSSSDEDNEENNDKNNIKISNVPAWMSALPSFSSQNAKKRKLKKNLF